MGDECFYILNIMKAAKIEGITSLSWNILG